MCGGGWGADTLVSVCVGGVCVDTSEIMHIWYNFSSVGPIKLIHCFSESLALQGRIVGDL